MTQSLEIFKSKRSQDNENVHRNNQRFKFDSWFYWGYWGLRFFSEWKREHYEVLDTHVFQLLSKDLIKKGNHHQIGDSFSYYIDMTPSNTKYYSYAVEHMKKESGENRLDELISQYRTQINKVNDVTKYNADQIVNQISIKCNHPDTDSMKKIFTFLNMTLGHIRENQEIHEWANSDHSGFVPHPKDPHYGKVIDCVNKLKEDEVIIQSFDEIRQNFKKLVEIATKIQQGASSISQAIHDKDYHINAKCCPSIITILKDLINRN